MSNLNPWRQVAPQPLATVGEGCTRRFDPQALSDDLGCSFNDASALWLRLCSSPNETPPEGGVSEPEEA